MLESIARGSRIASLIGAGLLAAGSAYAVDPIKLGVLEDQSRDFALATIGNVHGIPLPGVHAARASARQSQRGIRGVLQRFTRGLSPDRRSARRLRVLQ